MTHAVHLLTYADRLAGDLPGLARLLEGPLSAFDGVHVLPFFTPFDGADAGFDPDEHRVVDPRLGTWDDVATLAGGRDMTVDLIVNHVSTRSPEFRSFLSDGDASPHAGMFLTLDRVFPEGADEAGLGRIYRPRPGLPLTPIALADGTRRILWTTFTSEQVDLDVRDGETRRYLDELLALFAEHGVDTVRLDAVGYAIKTPGTSSFMTAETRAFLAELTERARGHGLRVLVEVHAHWRLTLELVRACDLTYDFVLPPLVLDALHTGDAVPLHGWLAMRPHNVVTVLDTHDGIGVIDVGANASHGDAAHPGPGLLPPERIEALVEAIHTATGGASRRATGAAASNVDLYQVNTTYLDALGGDVDAMLAARALQLMLPGSSSTTSGCCSDATTRPCSPRPGSAATSTGTTTRRRSWRRRSPISTSGGCSRSSSSAGPIPPSTASGGSTRSIPQRPDRSAPAGAAWRAMRSRSSSTSARDGRRCSSTENVGPSERASGDAQ